MAKSNNEFSYELIEFLGSLNEKEGWSKSVVRIAWGENPVTIDVRNMNIMAERMGKGISLSDEEADRLVDILLEKDYGSMEALEKALVKKKKRFTISVPENIFDSNNNEKLNIEIE